MNKQNIFSNFKLIAIAVLILAAILFFGARKKVNNEIKNFSFKNAVGQKTPDFTLKDFENREVNLAGLKGKNVVLFFNTGITCYPACVDQVVQLSKDERLNNENVTAYSIVMDTLTDWQGASKDLPYISEARVLFDSDGKISLAYDVLSLPSVMHGKAGHTYLILDKEGVVRYVLDDPYMGIRNEELAKEIEKLK